MMDKDIYNLHKKIAPTWEDVEKEQQYYNAALSHNIIKKSWETFEQYNKRLFYLEFGNNKKIIQAFERIQKYGYPKKCPALNFIINTIIF